MFQKLSAGLASGVLSVAMLTTVAPAADAVELPTRVQFYGLQIGTPSNAHFAQVTSAPGARRGTHDFEGGNGTRCRRMTHRINYATNVVSIRIPRRCLERPRWVRVGLDNALLIEGSNGEDQNVYMDNPHNHESFSDEVTRRLYRG